jgi:hypothetical protein
VSLRRRVACVEAQLGRPDEKARLLAELAAIDWDDPRVTGVPNGPGKWLDNGEFQPDEPSFREQAQHSGGENSP